jgi:flagellar biosynthesis/type III secretory pathway protein FliH
VSLQPSEAAPSIVTLQAQIRRLEERVERAYAQGRESGIEEGERRGFEEGFEEGRRSLAGAVRKLLDCDDPEFRWVYEDEVRRVLERR